MISQIYTHITSTDNRYYFKRDTDYAHPPTDWIALDTETGGLDARKNALLSIAVWSPDYHDSWLVHPFGVTEPQALEINGLSVDECKKEGLFPDACGERLLKAIKGRAIIGQNIGFDLGFLAQRVFGLAPNDVGLRLLGAWRIIDTCDMFRRLHPDEPRHLCDIAAHYGLEVDGQYHNALCDAEVTARVYMAMVAEMNKTC